jgi:hypothetical protein
MNPLSVRLHGRWLRGDGRALLAVVLLAGLCSVTNLADAGPPEPACFRDVRYTMLARKVLLGDRDLAPLNLGVRVHNRVATLWGPVPSLELMEKAVRLLRNVPDILDVRNELHVEVPEEPAPQFLPDRLPPPSPASLPGFSRADENWRGTFSALSTESKRPGYPSQATAQAWPAPAGPVLPAIRVPAPGSNGRAGKAVSADEAVGRLLRADERFRGLRAEVRGQQVHLSGTARRWQDVFDLAASIRPLPQVEHVILDEVRIQGP